MTLVFIQTQGVTTETQQLPELTSRGTAAADSALTVISSDPLPASEPSDSDRDDQADAAVDAGDPAARARLFGLYAGQIDARIERAWRRPRSPVDDVAVASLVDTAPDERMTTKSDRFECRVRIYQGDSGQVSEVELLSCNGTFAWKESLLRAIQAASPLPAPPSPTVFSNVITLTFSADEYRAGAPEVKYESGPTPHPGPLPQGERG